ncbi:MAG: SRPBCC domain-containing protein, partial [Gammaproteobacteria bacterium]|nr:SRPBCC domain-containing protein [Gammaproteobacteria bacterium]
IDVYHAWVLQPSAKGCLVVTEETQHGWLARLGTIFMPNRMHKYHQLWLEGLENKARAGFPPVE